MDVTTGSDYGGAKTSSNSHKYAPLSLHQQTIMETNHLISLTSLITTSVQEVISAYGSAGQNVPTLNTVEPGPFDSLAVDDVPEGLKHAVQVIEAACIQLMYTVSRPGNILLSKAKTHMEVACLSMVLSAGIPDLLANQPEGMDVSELAQVSGFTAGAEKLERVMRFLASKHVFRQVKPGVYAHNRLSMKLVSRDAISDAVAVSQDYSEASARLSQALMMPGGYKQTAFQLAMGYRFFDYYSLPENKDREERFQRSMKGWDEIYGPVGYLCKVYPWSTQAAGTVVCDIGGGTGYVTMGLMKKYPHLKLVIQDSAEVLRMAREFWGSKYPEALEGGRVDFVSFDFFKDAALENCDVYYLKYILHDWNDAECVTILKNVRKAMKPGSRVIVHDVVVRKVFSSDNPSDPDLPSWGSSEVNMYEYDIFMMELLDGKERTLEELVRLGAQSGLEFKEMYPAGDMALVEFSPM
ncbi:hypothetical protein VNI00_017463 [Paramarasmius palmivorus]|uniref:O-methyltransferase domain-containing protein n=1 Tax=Paramarasmius palmivorus TaxID=297713 RepID=A0AAW0B8F0_9AGAR